MATPVLQQNDSPSSVARGIHCVASLDRIPVEGTAAKTRGEVRADVATPIHVRPLLDEDLATWERYVKSHIDGTLFHTLAWRDAVVDAFPHVPNYLVATRGDRIVGLLPLFLINSRLVGRLLVSVPYGVGGGVLADDDAVATGLFERAKELAGSERCRMIDFRSERPVVPNLPINDRYVGFQRVLPDRIEDVMEWLPRKARAAARNARDKYSLTAAFGDEHLPTVWRLYTHTMRRVASIAYPFSFFRALIARTPNRHWVCVVRRDGRTIAGLVTFLFNNSVIPYFFGAVDEARRYDAGNFIYLTVMERAVAAGYRVFDFGRSRRDNAGSYDFKRFCGFEPRPLAYQYYVPPGCAPPKMSPSDGRYRVARRVWPRLPLAVTRLVGGWLSRHLPG